MRIGSGFRVQGLGFGADGSGRADPAALGFRVQG